MFTLDSALSTRKSISKARTNPAE